MASYLNLETLKGFLRDTATTYDALYTLILDGVEQAVETFIGRGPLAYAAMTEYYSPSGEYELTLDRFPLLNAASITAVYEDWGGNFGQTAGSFDAVTSLLVNGDDYSVVIEGVSKRAVLRRIGTPWPWGREWAVDSLSGLKATCPGSVKVTYSAGWTSAAPADVIAACYAEAAARWKLSPFGFGLPTSESVDGASASLTIIQNQIGKYAPFVTEMMYRAALPYRRIPVGR